MKGNALIAKHYLSEYQRLYGDYCLDEEDQSKLQKAQAFIERFEQD